MRRIAIGGALAIAAAGLLEALVWTAISGSAPTADVAHLDGGVDGPASMLATTPGERWANEVLAIECTGLEYNPACELQLPARGQP